MSWGRKKSHLPLVIPFKGFCRHGLRKPSHQSFHLFIHLAKMYLLGSGMLLSAGETYRFKSTHARLPEGHRLESKVLQCIGREGR